MDTVHPDLVIDPAGTARCPWGTTPSIYVDYHDFEWGRPVTDDLLLFEKLCLEGFQAGLSWLTILRKREAFREAFMGFDPEKVALFSEEDVTRLLGNAGIVRHRGKIESTINNARQAFDVIAENDSLANYFWRYAAVQPPPDQIPAFNETSSRLATDLKRRGFTFVGPTTVYAFMQAMGLVNDHLEGCEARHRCEAEQEVVRERFTSRSPGGR
ncbi:MAG TPA: DNA-3-methyladenine glycosylase I [Acidimicrobiia bacterium]|nr:DNA-3-methyladenine glycosylase I [Acidimicrobiia bacterium]